MNDNNSDSVRSIDSDESRTVPGGDVFEDGSAVICPDCGGDLQYQTRAAVVCLDCETEFQHRVTVFGGGKRHYVTRESDNATVARVIEATDDEPLVTDGGDETTTTKMPIRDEAIGLWYGKASDNVLEWGLQDAETLLLAMQEELGELTQAYLEMTHEDGDQERIFEELDDLGALLLQLDARILIDDDPEPVTDGGERDSLPLEEFSHTTAPEWALKIADDLDLNRTATSKARQFARDHGLNGDTSRRPRSVASGAIYLAAALHNDKRNQAEVAEVADVSTVTVATCYQEIAEAEGLISDSGPDSEVRTDGGTTERPGFVDPNTDYVRCHFCGAEWKPTEVDGMDLSDEDEYYPRMVPACPEHAGGCR